MFNTFIYQPLYNALITLLYIVPGANAGLAVVLLTLIVKILLLPFSISASVTQRKMKEITPEIEAIKEKHKDDKHKQAMEMLELYKKNNIRPFSSIFVMLLQIPVIFGLYFVFWKGGLPNIDPTLLYSFVPQPNFVPDMHFLGVDLSKRSLVFAVLAGLSQALLTHLTLPETPKGGDLKSDMVRGMHLQMKYFLPVIIAIVAYSISSVIALYWITSNIFGVFQELTIKKFLSKQ